MSEFNFDDESKHVENPDGDGLGAEVGSLAVTTREQAPSDEVEQEENVDTLPAKEELIGRLREAGIYGVTPQTDRLYDAFLGYVAGQEKVGMGLLMAWELAKYDTLQGLPNVMLVVVDMNFDEIVRLVSPKLADDAISFKKQVSASQDKSQVPS